MPHALAELHRALALARSHGQKDVVLQLETELKLWPSSDSSDKPKADGRR